MRQKRRPRHSAHNRQRRHRLLRDAFAIAAAHLGARMNDDFKVRGNIFQNLALVGADFASDACRRSAGHVQAASCSTRSRGRWSGKFATRGFFARCSRASAVAAGSPRHRLLFAFCQTLAAWPSSRSPSINSICSISRSSFSDDRPKRARLQHSQLRFQLLDMQRFGVEFVLRAHNRFGETAQKPAIHQCFQEVLRRRET